MPTLTPDNYTTIIVAILAFASAFFTARFGVKKNSIDTLGRVQLENAALKVRVKELEDALKVERNKTALEMKHRIEAETELEVMRKMGRKRRRKP